MKLQVTFEITNVWFCKQHFNFLHINSSSGTRTAVSAALSSTRLQVPYIRVDVDVCFAYIINNIKSIY